MSRPEKLLVCVLALAALVTLARLDRIIPAPDLGWSSPPGMSWRQKEIVVVRAKAQLCRSELDGGRWRVAQDVVTGGPAYRAWVLRRWRARLVGCSSELAFLNSHPEQAIAAVFGVYAGQAVAVAYCETGGTFDVNATNGQYRGLFQMGANERATYGHGSTALEQARAAQRYFVASGSDWSPWSCRP